LSKNDAAAETQKSIRKVGHDPPEIAHGIAEESVANISNLYISGDSQGQQSI